MIELRVLEGPNLYFPRAAIKLTLDIRGLATASEETASSLTSSSIDCGNGLNRSAAAAPAGEGHDGVERGGASSAGMRLSPAAPLPPTS